MPHVDWSWKNYMKYRYLTILCMIILCIAGCGNTDGSKGIEDNGNSEAIGETEGTDPVVSPEPVILAHSEEYTSDNYKPGNFSDNQNYAVLKRAAYSDKGFYALNEDDNCVYFIDADNVKQTVLCHELSCGHSDYDCNAWYLGFQGIYYNDGYVYVMAEDMAGMQVYLYRMDPDGSNRVTVAKLYSREEEDLPCSPQFIIHRGTGYLTVNWMDTGQGIEREQCLYRVSLADGSMDEIYKFKGYSPNICIENTEDNNIYFGVSEYKNGNIGKASLCKEYCYNAEDEKITERSTPENGVLFASYNDKMYSLDREEEYLENGMVILKKFKIYVTDTNGKKSKCIYKITDEEIKKQLSVQEVNFDGKYIYIRKIFKGLYYYLCVIDKNGKEIFTLDCNKAGMCRWSDGNKLLLIDNKTCRYSLYDIRTKSVIAE